MSSRRTSAGDISELPGIRSGHEDSGEHHQYENRAQDGGCHFLKGLHCMLLVTARPARSASEIAAIMTRETTRVTLTMRSRARPSAACQANWPSPRDSH